MKAGLCLVLLVALSGWGLGTADGEEQVVTKRVNCVLLGSTGNLAKKYLWQGFYNIDKEGLARGERMFVYAAATKSAEISSPLLRSIFDGNISAPGYDKSKFLMRVSDYKQLREEDQYKSLGEEILARQEKDGEDEVGRLIYLSVPPQFYGSIAKNINAYLRPAREDQWLRVIVEKPFGLDSESAEKLAQELHESLSDDEILLVDHYMGKQGLEAIRLFRHANPELDSLLNNQNVESVEVAMLETEDCHGRTSFYEEVGVIRDTLQNHLMCMVALLTMDMDIAQQDEAAARAKVIRNLKTADANSVRVLGQYRTYNKHINEDRVKWGQEPLEKPSLVPTYADIVLQSNLPDWKGVDFIFRSGKALDARRAYARINFNNGDTLLFNLQGTTNGIEGAKVVGTGKLAGFNPPHGWTKQSETMAIAPPGVSAYEALLRAGLEGRTEQFVHLPEVLASWKVWTPLLEQIDQGKVDLTEYGHGAIGLDFPPDKDLAGLIDRDEL